MQSFVEKNYHITFNFPDEFNFSWNYIRCDDCYNYPEFIKNLKIHNNQSLIVLWGIGHRIDIYHQEIEVLNEFYESISNPMILVNGQICQQPDKLIRFPYAEWPLFQFYVKTYYETENLSLWPKPKKFLFASTKDYLSRKYLLCELYKNNLLAQGHVSYKCHVKNYTMERFQHDVQNKFIDDCSIIDSLLPLPGFDDSPEVLMIPPSIGRECYTSIVTDTFFTGKHLFFSEKVFCSMLFKHIIFYLGPAHSLKYLRSVGFKTFSHIIDESYDTIENDSRRVVALAKSMIDFLSKPIEEIHKIYFENLELLEHNQNLVNSLDLNALVNEGFQKAIKAKRDNV